jgi:MtaA/CmuA family methyltransferase
MARRLHGEPVDRPPDFNIFMTFAAHHVGQPLSRYYTDYRVLCDANFAVMEDFSIDVAQAISDPYREAADWGLEVEFPEDGLPVRKSFLVNDPADVDKLVPPDPATGRRMSDRLEAIRLFRERVGGDVPVMGWVEGAMAEVADLRGDSNLMYDFYDRSDWLADFLEKVTEIAIAFARAQIEAGADIIGLGDAIASQLSPEMYTHYALPYEQRIFEAVHEAGGLARLHICGDTSRILAEMARSGADIIDIDWMVDIDAAIEAFGDVALCGNFDPVRVMLQGSPDEVYAATINCLERGGPRLFSGAGCEIPDGTPHENLHAQMRAIRDFA